MKSMLIHRFGNSSEFELGEIPMPKVSQGEVLIKVAATSVNPLDYKLRSGAMPGLITNFPMVLHGDLAGTIVEVADDVDNFKPGDEIYGCVGGLLNMQGALAEYVVADKKLISLKPKTLDMNSAAALPLVVETAWEALFLKANLQSSQTVLIHGGTGGVGHVAIQMAKSMGATVFTTVSSDQKATIAKSLGADHVINYKHQQVADYVNTCTDGKGFDVVFDTIGGTNLRNSITAVANCGSVVTIMPHGDYNLDALFLKNASLHCLLQPLPLITGVNREKHGDILAKVSGLVDAGKLKPLIDEKRFKLEEVGEAHDYLEAGKALGKVIVSLV